ncbi:MAG: hypothetical protein A2Y40_05170 [Candidatus Margulisbacteria bacterium GWF2_35_9]|nr:MAG: hypothetical protein A2Y40_05170 [Candidatus Margulisbacteria bacterium GWF2_35_9]
MFKSKSKLKQKPDLLLSYYAEITKSKHLHFGMWEKDDDLDMKHLLIAQDRYSQHVLSFIPKSVKSVLDVGAGVGGNAQKMLNMGLSVKAVSPDSILKTEFEKNTNHKIPYILTKFETLDIDENFDMVLMSESVQYINVIGGFKKAREVLNKGGYLLTIDYYHEEGIDDRGIMLAGHPHNYYLSEAKKHGFTLVKSDDITNSVAPSFDFMSDMYRTYLIPSLKVIVKALDVHLPFAYKIARLLFRKRLKKDIEKNLITGEDFKKYRKYMLYLFQLDK